MSKFQLYIICALLSLIHLFVNGQEFEQLSNKLNQAKNQEEKFSALLKLSDYWSYRDTAKSFESLKIAQPLIEGDKYRQARYLFYQAGVYYGYDNPKSQKLYMEAEEYFKHIESPEAYGYRAKLWHNYGSLEQQSDNDKLFLDITLNYCIPFAIKSGDNNLLMSYFTDVGMVFYNNNEYGKAMDYYEKAVSLVKTEQDETENLLWTYLNMFDVYFYQKERDKQMRILEKAEALLKKLPEQKLAGALYKNKARSLNQEGKYVEALQNIEKGMAAAKEYNSYWDFYSLKYEKAQIYKNSGNLQAAKTELAELLNDTRGSAMTKSRLAIITELAQLEFQLGNYKGAYELILKHKLANDSLSALDFRKQLAEMETQYRTKEKEQEIEILENRNLLNRALIFGGAFLVLVLGSWLWYAWNVRKKRNLKDTILLRQQREIDVAKALVEGEEQERKRVARELHDGLLGRVTGLKMNVERIARDKSQNEYPMMISELETVINDLRHTAQNLEPSILKRNGLNEAIQHFCQSMQTDKTKISYYGHGMEEITDKNLQLSIYRIVQELVTNAVKHANASHILLQCSLENNYLLIEAEDNGKGFDPVKINRNMGLDNLESRLKTMSGSMKIDSKPNEGTHIIIECQL